MQPTVESKYGAHTYFVYDNSLKQIKGHHTLITSIFSFIIITASLVNFAYGQGSQGDSNTSNNNSDANSIDIQNLPAKKVQVGDIDIAYKTFGKGDPILLINGYFHYGQLGYHPIRDTCLQPYGNRF